MQFTHHLSVRLFLFIFFSMAILFSLYLTININLQGQQHLECAATNGTNSADLTLSALRYSMLENDRVELSHTIRAIGEEKFIRTMRVIDKNGVVKFSSDSSEVGRRIEITSDACHPCHQHSEPLARLDDKERVRIHKTLENEYTLSIINPIKNAQKCSNAGCHAHSPGTDVLGVLDTRISLERQMMYISESTQQSVKYGLSAISLFAVFFGLLIFKTVQAPVSKLIDGTQEISKGNLNYRLDSSRKDEIGEFARSFNQMAHELKEAREEITNWNRTLEDRVVEKHHELQRAEEHMRQIDKLASLGKLAASVAHELNNPLAGVLTYAKLVERKLKKDNVDVEENGELIKSLHIMQEQTARCGKIVQDLLLFARRDAGDFQEAELHQIMDKSVGIVQHKADMEKIEIEQKYGGGSDSLECDQTQIQQAFIAILVNAIEAVGESGKIKIETEDRDDSIEIRIIDNGPGIPPEVKKQIFDPFYSTKADAKGVGLGLSIVYGIIQRHNGMIWAESEVGEGTTFYMVLPRRQHSTINPKG